MRRWPPLIFTIRKGAPFITQLRIHWLHMRNHAAEKGVGRALTIQLLGSVDDMVSPEDNIDLVSGRDFVYLDVPYSGHANVVEMDDPRPLPAAISGAAIRTIGEARAAVFRAALTTSEAALLEDSVVPSDLLPEAQRRAVSDVVFVIHSIRDVGYWTHKIARRVLTGQKVAPPPGIASTRQSLAVKLSGLGAPLLWAGILAPVIMAYPAIWNLDLAEWHRTLLVAGFTWAIWKVVTVV